MKSRATALSAPLLLSVQYIMLLQGCSLEMNQQSNSSIRSVVVECTLYNVVAGLQPGGEAAEQQPFHSVVVVLLLSEQFIMLLQGCSLDPLLLLLSLYNIDAGL